MRRRQRSLYGLPGSNACCRTAAVLPSGLSVALSPAAWGRSLLPQQLACRLAGHPCLFTLCHVPAAAGSEISFGDCALFPTFVFFTEILPKHFGWASVFEGRPKLERWWAEVQKDPEAARVGVAAPRGTARQAACYGAILRPLFCMPAVTRAACVRVGWLAGCRPVLQVIAEMRSGLADWESSKRWDTLGISAQVADGSFNWSCN